MTDESLHRTKLHRKSVSEVRLSKKGIFIFDPFPHVTRAPFLNIIEKLLNLLSRDAIQFALTYTLSRDVE
jgi:hypothetical protein